MTPSGIKPTTYWFVAQCLKQLHHRVPHHTTRGLTKCSQHTHITNFLKQEGNACSKRTCFCSQTPLTGSQSTHTLTICIIHSISSCKCLPLSRKHNNSRVSDDSVLQCSIMISPALKTTLCRGERESGVKPNRNEAVVWFTDGSKSYNGKWC